MTEAQQTTLILRGMISQLPAEQRKACEELAELIRANMRAADEPVGTLAIALVGAELQEKSDA